MSNTATVKVPAAEVKVALAAAGITEGYGSRGRVSLASRTAFVTLNPKRAREVAAAAGIALSSKKGRLSKSDTALVASTLIGG